MNIDQHVRPKSPREWTTRKSVRIASAAALLVAAVGLRWYLSVAPAKQYVQTNLVSDVPGVALTVDSSLVNPWGMALAPSGPWWVADNGKGISTLYSGDGMAYPALDPLIVTIPPSAGVIGISAPSGLVYNGSADFTVDIERPARFIFVTEDGTISGWNPEVDKLNAVLAADHSNLAVYKGVAIARMAGRNYLYAANFWTGTVDVFDTYFHQEQLSEDAFIDVLLPEDFAPSNVQNIGEKIYVAYAKQDLNRHDPVRGAGLGFVTVFDTSGKLLLRFQSGTWLNAPWGMALAPDDFGKYSRHLLVGNSGNGTIAAFDPKTGDFKGLLEATSGYLVTIQGLRGIGFGNGSLAGPTTVLYFSAGIEEGEHGLFGSLKPAP
jgi:uncharacterized protein (TIGR03118 family)